MDEAETTPEAPRLRRRELLQAAAAGALGLVLPQAAQAAGAVKREVFVPASGPKRRHGNAPPAPAWSELPFPEPIRSLVSDREGVLFAATGTAIHCSTDLGKAWRCCHGPALLYRSASGEAWLIDGASLWRHRDGSFQLTGSLPQRSPPEGPGSAEASVSTFGVAPGGELWLGQTSVGLSTYPGGRPGIFEAAEARTHRLCRSPDSGATWVQVSDAVVPEAIAFDQQGRALVGGSLGVHVWDGGVLRPVVDKFPWGVKCLAVEASGRVVIGTPSSEPWVSATTGVDFERTEPRSSERGPWGALEAAAHSFIGFTLDPKGAVWGATGQGFAFRLLPPPALKWESHNLGLAMIAGQGMRVPALRPTAIAAHPGGAIFLAHAARGDYPGAARGLLCLERP